MENLFGFIDSELQLSDFVEPMSSALLVVNEQAMQLIGHGAEGKVFATIFLSRPTIVKERVSKKYRVKELDQRLTLLRLRQEARCMVKCRRAGVLTPR